MGMSLIAAKMKHKKKNILEKSTDSIRKKSVLPFISLNVTFLSYKMLTVFAPNFKLKISSIKNIKTNKQI